MTRLRERKQVSSLAIGIIVSYSCIVLRLRRPFPLSGYFFITVRLLNERAMLANAIERERKVPQTAKTAVRATCSEKLSTHLSDEKPRF